MLLKPLARSALALLLGFAQIVDAVFEDDAFNVDYHLALIGAPQQHSTFFHQPNAAIKASLVYSISDRGILGAIHPRDGTIVWRQDLQPCTNTSSAFLRGGEGQDTVVSGVDGHVSSWSSGDGRLVWRYDALDAVIRDLEVLELDSGTFFKDVVALHQEHGSAVVTRIDGSSGKEKWRFRDSSGDIPFQVSASDTTIFYLSLHSTMLGGYKIVVNTLDSVTGKKIDKVTISSESEVSSPESILFVGANIASPLIIWTDKNYKILKANILGTKSVISLNVEAKDGQGVEKIAVHAPHKVNALPHFLVHYQSAGQHWAEVFHVDLQKGSISKAYDIPTNQGQGVFALSNIDANVYFTRITESEVSVLSSSSHGILGRWPYKPGNTFPSRRFQPLHGISEVAVRGESASAVRTAVFMSNGFWVLIRNGEASWSRPELLSNIIHAVWAEIPEEQTLAQKLELGGNKNVFSAFLHRIERHVEDLQHFPAWAQNLPSRLLSSFGKTSITAPAEGKRDNFGFHKLVIVVTKNGQLVAIDAGKGGKVLWSYGLENYANIDSITNFRLTPLGNGCIEISGKALGKMFIINALSGEQVNAEDAMLQISDTAMTQKAPEETVLYDQKDGELFGYMIGTDSTEHIWHFQPANGERFIDVLSRPEHDPVASLGHVLGDRRVLYKYLNSNLLLVTTAVDETDTISIYILDSISGNILHSASHHHVDTSQPITSALTENWAAYSFALAPSLDNPSRGYQLVVVELFESSIPNDRGPLGSASNFSSIRPLPRGEPAPKPHVLSQTYQIPEPISHMSATTSLQGITSRQLLAVLPQSNSIIGIPRYVLDPRRPVGRDPTKDELMEGLSRYMPTLEFDPRWYLNHVREVFGIDEVLVTPSALESTSLLFAHGLDVFGTRVSPSAAFDVLGKEFNKFQMSATVLALFGGVLFVAPLVARKQINSLWQM